ncbi:hypothetical protein A1O1_04348 [Capronia coronata CBS 617.96]|uniref:Uncharacterized protein n=1 Tax=Capronia coronata CBS 617.96 TaxID=1182541 RepID=W9YFA6_9EURO|nr:uncharacterized protein A1O1_04348 [Capronia coronata CBS 617.96]EXJ91238.1 hypothetical protein A1O1_04348 [Capronia coronata CBS 617.96]
MRSITAFVLAAFMATAAQCSAESKQEHGMLTRFYHEKTCAPSKAGDCSSCGADYVQCGTDACYNPKAGETCCQTQYACPATFKCSSTGSHCVLNNGSRGGPDCDDDAANHNNSTVTTTGVVVSTAASSATSITSGPPVAVVMPTSDSNTTTYTTTITLTTTNTISVSATTPGCGLSAATTGLPVTSSMVPYGNSTTVALNTTTSTMSVTNVTVHAATNYNASKPTSSIKPPISGYKGAAADLHAQSSTSLFALGCFMFMAALWI